MQNLRKYLLTAGLFGIALALPSQSMAAPHQTFHSKFAGLTADASFDSFDASGCVETSAFLTATNGRNLAPGGPQDMSTVFVSLSQFDFCAFTDVLEASGLATLPRGALQINQRLTSATLNTSIQAVDFISSTTLTVSVNLSWSGSGELNTSINHFIFRQPGSRTNATFDGRSRQATASGTIAAASTTFSPLPSAFADLMDVKEGELAVSK